MLPNVTWGVINKEWHLKWDFFKPKATHDLVAIQATLCTIIDCGLRKYAQVLPGGEKIA